MLELLIYVVLLLVVMPAALLGLGKVAMGVAARPARSVSASGGASSSVSSGPVLTEPARYETLQQRLAEAAKANPLLPRRR